MIRILLLIFLSWMLVLGLLILVRRNGKRRVRVTNVFYNPDDPSVEKQKISKHQHALMRIGQLEHELDGYLGMALLPHNDSWVTAVCTRCKRAEEAEAKREAERKENESQRKENESQRRLQDKAFANAMAREGRRKEEIEKALRNAKGNGIAYVGEGIEVDIFGDDTTIFHYAHGQTKPIKEVKYKRTKVYMAEVVEPAEKLHDHPILIEGRWEMRSELEEQWIDFKSRGGTINDLPLGSQIREIAEGLENRRRS